MQEAEHLSVWKSGEVPEYLSYGSNPRTLDIVVLADSSWCVVIDESKTIPKGSHGYDNTNKDLNAIFYAYGPAFKQGYISSEFNNVDIYPLICEILDLEPAPVDGKLENVKQLLEN